jgi:hypothetical protein
MSALITTQAYDLDASANVIAGALALDTVQLIQTNLALDRNTTLADVLAAIPTYVGYAAGVITWLAPSIADDGSIEVVGTVPEFRPTNSVTPNSIFGAALINAAGNKLHAVSSLDGAPIPMASALNSILLTVRYKVSEQGAIVTIT